MSTAGQGGQAVTFTVEEAQVLRGAFNVVCELLTQPGLEIPPGIPISGAREPLFDRLASQLDNHIGQAGGVAARFQEVLDPAEAQAVRDVAGALEALLQDPGGREVLATVGFLAQPDQPVDRREAETLQDVIQRVDPTGVRDRGDHGAAGHIAGP